MEHEFLFGIFRPEKQDYLFKCSVAPGNSSLERPKKSCSIYFPNEFFRNLFVNGKQPTLHAKSALNLFHSANLQSVERGVKRPPLQNRDRQFIFKAEFKK